MWAAVCFRKSVGAGLEEVGGNNGFISSSWDDSHIYCHLGCSVNLWCYFLSGLAVINGSTTGVTLSWPMLWETASYHLDWDQ